ncbi:MAG TPA: DHHA1 domain-containing protein [Pyrinomonadaceae bacterium]|nr:DHHA1 domain-containing protein [Pyrinomonadaceae bacterium]
MPVTERLYYSDSHLIEFEARVVDVTERVSGWTAVILDRTAFYPTGGGQPSDTGTLNGSRVVECIDDGERGVLHVVQGSTPARDSIVAGRVDWLRRLDHMQQHTGQHILSQAFVKLFNAPTKSFRVSEATCEIDIELANPATEIIERAVELANNVIWEDRVITVHHVSSEEAATMPLRKEPSREGELRLIEIDGFDLTPCGGTHAYRTGEVGMIAVRSWERAKGLTRIEFVAGVRALADYRKANRSAREVAALFSTGRDDAREHAAHLVEENKELHRRVRALEELEAEVEAQRLLASAFRLADRIRATRETSAPTAPSEEIRVVTHGFEARDAEFLKKVAHSLIAHTRTIALLGSRDKDAARLIFARSADAPGDMNALMREACALLDGRGGGKPDLAQGGGRNPERLQEALDQAVRSLSTNSAS